MRGRTPMKSHWISASMLATCAAAALSAQEGDLKKLQGTWAIVSLDINGQAMSGMSSAQFLIQGDHFTARGMGAIYEGTIQLDAAPAPKHLDLNFTAGPEKGNKSVGIYE